MNPAWTAGSSLALLHCAIGLFLISASSARGATYFTPTTGTWRMWKGTSEASTPTTAWRQRVFNDTAWTAAPAPVYFSTSGTEPPFYAGGVFTGTTLSDMRNGYSSVYLRREFVVPNPGAVTQLTLATACDDGFIVWINGTEVRRVNVAAGERAFNGLASGNASEPQPVASFIITDTAMLQPGTNVMAVHAFNSALNNADFGFMAGLTSPTDDVPPVMSNLLPTAGVTVSDLSVLEVTFNEAVVNVEAGDLLLEGVPATGVTPFGLGQFRFTFAQSGGGLVHVAWAVNHGIQDSTGNAFAGGAWTYVFDPNAVAQRALISEFMVANVSTLADEDGEFPDWIEILNPRLEPVDLGGWFLTDDPDRLDQWSIPPVLLAPGARLVIFASGKDRRGPAPPWHANFQLSSDGEYLALVQPDGTIASAFSPTYPKQKSGVSFGLVAGTSTNGYLSTPTPGTGNPPTTTEFVADTKFSRDRGFSETNFDLVISCATPGATIYYTTNGTLPGPGSGAIYTTPLPIRRTSIIRARAEKPGARPSNVDTHTYLFLRDILVQSTNGVAPPGWPSSWGDNDVDYGMDPDIVFRAPSNATISNDLRSLPTLSLVMRLEDLFDPTTGIYANPAGDGAEWERLGSLELIFPDDKDGFQLDAGVRIRGGFSRSTSNPKHSWRIVCRDEYGVSRLRYPLFGPSGASDFDHFDLRTSQDGSYAYLGEVNGLFLNDPFTRDTLLATGQPGERGHWYHLYIDGQYWGLYNTCERPDGDFGASYLGGRKEDYDVLKPQSGLMTPIDGNDAAWVRLWNAANAGFASTADYFRVQGRNPDGTVNPAFENLLDMTNLVDFLLTIIYVGDWDGPIYQDLLNGYLNNYYAFRARDGWHGGFRFATHDAELTIEDLNENRAGITQVGDPRYGYAANRSNPHYLATRLRVNPEYVTLFADRAYRHLFGDGVMTPSAAAARFAARTNELHRAITGESARWGDAQRPTSPIMRSHWIAAVTERMVNYFPFRTAVVVNQLRAEGLFPTLAPPRFTPEGGELPFGAAFALGHTNAAGQIFYTLNGSDPRAIGGGLSVSALNYAGPVTLTASRVVRTRVKNGVTWSPLVEATYYPAQDFGALRLTEVMFRPPDEGAVNGDEFEFLELKNTGTNALDLGGASFSGINFAFTNGTRVDPGQFVVLARNPARLSAKHPALVIHGTYSGRLDNGGETISLRTALGVEILSLSYGDRVPWAVAADGHGFSLVPVSSGGTTDPNDGLQWRASRDPGGSPGRDDPAPTIAPVILNEILSHTDPPDTDAIELYNPTTNRVELGGWYLTDDPAVPRKFRIPNGTGLDPGAFVVFREVDFNPALPTAPNVAFALSSLGEEIYLFSGTEGGTNISGYTHGRTFGAAALDVTFGRYLNSVGEEFFPAQSAGSLGSANAAPRVGPLVMSEIHYHPLTNYDEYVELFNFSPAPLDLFGPAPMTNTWRVSGLGFTFPPGVTLPPRTPVLLVSLAPSAFRTKYSVPPEVPIFQFSGALQDSGERLEIERPDLPGTNGTVPYIVVDEVRYNDRAPWPVAADGDGPALQRLVVTAFGSEPTNWVAAGLTPGRLNRANQPPAVALVSPTNHAEFFLPALIPMEATATDVDGSIRRVEFFDGSVKIGEATNAPWRFSWTTAGPGTRQLSAHAYDDELAAGVSTTVSASVRSPVPPQLRVTLTQGMAELAFIRAPQQGYTVEASASLAPATWVPITSLPALPTATEFRFLQPVTNPVVRFFRAVTRFEK